MVYLTIEMAIRIRNRTSINLMFYLALIFVCPLSANAADKSVRFQHFNRKDGLSQAHVLNVVQDHQGFILFGTQVGLNRFDGSSVRVFTNDSSSINSISDNSIRTMLVDTKGTLWIATDTGGLSKYNPIQENFTNYLHGNDPTTIATNRVRTLLEDKAGNLWIGTDGAGLELLDRETETFLHPVETGALFANPNIWALAEGEPGELWVGTNYGLYLFNTGTKAVTQFLNDPLDPHSLSDDRIRSLLWDSDGALWVGTQRAGLDRFDQASGRFSHFPHDPADPLSLSNDTVTALFQDADDVVWIGTLNGLNALEPGRPGFFHYSHEVNNPFSIAHNHIMSIYQDRGGVIWIGTFDGLSYWNQSTMAMSHYAMLEGYDAGLRNNTVTSFGESRGGDVFVGTYGGGVNRFTPRTGRFSPFGPFESGIDGSGGDAAGDGPALKDDRVMSMMVDRRDNLWVGTQGAGVGRFNLGDGTAVYFQHDAGDAGSLSANTVSAILEGADDRVWIGTYTGGLNVLDPVSLDIVSYRHSSSADDSISSDRVVALFEDSDGVLWVGTHGGGLNRFNAAAGTFERIRHDPGDINSLSGDNIFMITEQANGDLWIGTQGHGLNRWSQTDRRNGVNFFERVTKASGLASPTVYAGLWDESGYLWLSSNNGLSRFDVESRTFKHFDTSHGLQNLEFNQGAAFAAASGELYFGGINGFNVFDPAAMKPNAHAPPTVITAIAKLNKPVEHLPRVLADGLELTHEDYLVEFQFSGLDFSAPEKNRYRYRLDGLDKDWVEAGTRRYASYTNLAPGDYTFRVKAANNDGLWSTEEARLTITVVPPPWLSWYAYLLYACIFMVVALLVFRDQWEKAQRAGELTDINKVLMQEIEFGKDQELALHREEIRSQTYLDIAEIVLVAIDGDGLVRLINRKGRDLFGLVEEQILGRRWLDYIPTNYQDGMWRQIVDSFSRGYNLPDTHFECTIKTSKRENRRIMWRFAPLSNEGGDLVLASGMDVTQVRDLEKAIRMREKLSAVGTMASGIAHDFNNILTAVYGYGMLTLKEVEDQQTPFAYVQKIVAASERASSLVTRLLTFTNLEEQDLNPCDLGPSIIEAAALLRGSLPPMIEMSVDIDQELKPVLADPTQIHQLVMNLGTNAGKAMEDQLGTMEITAHIVTLTESNLPADSELKAGEHLKIFVSDTGVGMTEETLMNIFDPFFTSLGLGFGKDKGTGLGLSVVHGIVNGHQGHVAVDSVVGQGTRFTIYLPCCVEDVTLEVVDKPGVHPDVSRILLVDDEEWVTDVSKRMLEPMGYLVTTFNHPQDAIRAFEADPNGWDVLITDQVMPVKRGLELVSEMRVLRPDLPVVLMSGNVSPFDESNPDRSIVFLAKPYTLADLRSSIDDAVSILHELERQAS